MVDIFDITFELKTNYVCHLQSDVIDSNNITV